MALTLPAFIERWQKSGAEERANKDLFFAELCDVLEVPRPNPKTGDPALDVYVFEKDVHIPLEGGTTTIGRVDLYKEHHVLIEAKQGKGELSKKLSSAKRGTPAWNVAMADAFGQALGYARTLDKPPPFVVAVDLGHCFDLYASFDGTANYRPFPNPVATRIFFADLANHLDTLRRVFLDPHSLDPAKQSAKVTREVATHLAELAQALEKAGHGPEAVATFLMRCLFTMFAEDVGLLPPRLFTDAIEKFWMESPRSFPGGIESLWNAMNTGSDFGFIGKLLRFNGGLFAAPSALPLTRDHLALLLEAAKCNWADVEPAIFGTLLERALNPKERHSLGAHYTPRAYVERLVRPTIEEPLRSDWQIVQVQVRQLVEADKVDAAKKAVRGFHQKLCATRVLDPACGSGNFLYVTLDLFKQLEAEVLSLLEALGEKQTLLHADMIRVTPAQFLGIEVKRWAKEIAELVLWIGYLQHHFRTYGKNILPPEPVLQDYKNIECRDAVLTWDSMEYERDAGGKIVERWDGETTKSHPVTGLPVPDESAQVPREKYINPRKAEWPKAEFIVGNPPFVGTRRMRLVLGDGYVEALVRAIPEVPENADYVMYWWDRCAEVVRAGQTRSFGLITTNSIHQSFNRVVLQRHLTAKNPLSITFAIPDHPWVESAGGAAVRVAMTVGVAGDQSGRLLRVLQEVPAGEAVQVTLSPAAMGRIAQDLRVGASPAGAGTLRANAGIAYWGAKFYGDGFIVTREKADELSQAQGGSGIARPFVSARDFTQSARGLWVLDCDGLEEDALRERYPATYQHLLDHVKPVRAHNPRAFKRDRWWILGENQPGMRRAVNGLSRYIATPETAKHRTFQFLPTQVLAEGGVSVIALDDALFLGILSASIHVVWALAAGGRLGVGNDPRYNKTRCFDPFPFPQCPEARAARIRDLGEQLDAHRKRQQALHAELTITGMYNVLQKLRSGEPLAVKEKVIHEQGLCAILKQLHDELDAAVFDAYGWPRDLSDEQILERLVTLNAERAEEERKGQVRWLRPDFQNPGGVKAHTQTSLVGVEETEDSVETASEGTVQAPWPKKLPEQVGAVRDLVLRGASAWSAKAVAQAFKGASAKGVEPVLESLAALGLVVGYEAGGVRKWKAARAATS